jgi:hypothetical protein
MNETRYFAPVAAWYAGVTKSGPEVECPTCDYYTYTITANSFDWAEHILRVSDTLPAGLFLRFIFNRLRGHCF